MRTRAGLALALAAAVISGFSVYINSGVTPFGKAYGGATVYTTAKNLVAAVVLAVVPWSQPPQVQGGLHPAGRPAQWAALAAVAVIGGSIPFVLFFEGLARASSTNAAFIQKTLVIWVAVLAVPLLRERLARWHIAAIAGLVCGPGAARRGPARNQLRHWRGDDLRRHTAVGRGDHRGQRLLPGLSVLTVATARMGGGVLILVGYTPPPAGGRARRGRVAPVVVGRGHRPDPRRVRRYLVLRAGPGRAMT